MKKTSIFADFTAFGDLLAKMGSGCFLASVKSLAMAVCKTFQRKGKVYIFGNGGSASQAEHFQTELVGKFMRYRKGYPVICLNSNTGLLTALGNDFDWDELFDRQLQAQASEGDLVVGLTTSGESLNVTSALAWAHRNDIATGIIVGQSKVLGDTFFIDHSIVIPSTETPRIQEATLLVLHSICRQVEDYLVHWG